MTSPATSPAPRTGLSIAEARRNIHEAVQLLAPRRADVASSIGATLAEPLRTRAPLPVADVAAMDGFAVRGPGPWVLRTETQTAGTDLVDPLQPGQAVRIGTGARLPEHASAVLRDEHVTNTTLHSQPAITVQPGISPRDDTRRRGESWSVGTDLAAVGARISPAVASVAITAEHRLIQLRGPVRAHVVLTGDEIYSGAAPLDPGQTRDCIGPVLPYYLNSLDIITEGITYTPDRAHETCHAIAAANKNADLIVVVGATRCGPADRVRNALRTSGAVIIIDGLTCRPGGSQIVAQIPEGPAVLCLPGNPYAALAALMITAPEIVAALTGRTPQPRLTARIPECSGLAALDVTRVLPAKRLQDGRWSVHSGPQTAHLAGLVGWDAFALIPPGASPETPTCLIPISG